MTPETRERLVRLRVRSKRGEPITPLEVGFLEDCWRLWPKEYEALGREVFKEAAPFGYVPPQVTDP